ncbi:hypothetical protein [Azospirillum brasilense]|uniref:hypothetical protein n=1 Tax=Azospirillum brasilense TaxID=192 RepID=UPI0019658832|nr:hypothetical protein [Azospirillum brasilense]
MCFRSKQTFLADADFCWFVGQEGCGAAKACFCSNLHLSALAGEYQEATKHTLSSNAYARIVLNNNMRASPRMSRPNGDIIVITVNFYKRTSALHITFTNAHNVIFPAVSNCNWHFKDTPLKSYFFPCEYYDE